MLLALWCPVRPSPRATPHGRSFRRSGDLAAPAPGVALTFDDGPHPEGTPAMLEVLARAGARATFFVVGEQVQRRPALLAEIAAAGHAVALHGYRHRLQLRLSASGAARGPRPRQRRDRGRDRRVAASASPAVRDLQPRRAARRARGRPAAAAVVALGQGLAQVHDARADRRAGPRASSAPET